MLRGAIFRLDHGGLRPGAPSLQDSRVTRSRDMSAAPYPPASRFGDPRDYQIAVLSGLLIYGTLVLELDIRPLHIPLTLAVALVTQWACSRLWKPPAFDPRSALISVLSLCLLLRVDTLWAAAAAAFSRSRASSCSTWGGKHVFNPTNGAIVLMLLITPAAWLSPGQWGNVAFFAFLIACLGGLVAHRALRCDVALAFIVVYAALMFGRAYDLGDPMTIPMRRLESGGLLLFTFFMISDPRTTPDHPIARVLFGALVACVAWYIQFRLFRTNGVIWSLALCAPLVPVLDRVLPGRRFSWTDAAACRCCGALRPLPSHWKGSTCHETPSLAPLRVGRARRRGAGAGRRLLRLLRLEGRRQAVQQGVEGRHRARRQPHRAHDVERLQGRSQGVRDRRAGARRSWRRSRSTSATRR